MEIIRPTDYVVKLTKDEIELVDNTVNLLLKMGNALREEDLDEYYSEDGFCIDSEMLEDMVDSLKEIRSIHCAC